MVHARRRREAGAMFSYVTMEQRIRKDRPIRPIRAIVDRANAYLAVPSASVCEVAGEVKDELGRVGGKGVDGSVGGGHNGHVGSDRAIDRVQR